MKFYIVDTTKREKNQSPVVIFDSVPELIKYLDGACQRQFKWNRKQYMEHAADLGIAQDDTEGRSFFECMSEYFQIGMITKDNKPRVCNIFDVKNFSSKDYGD